VSFDGVSKGACAPSNSPKKNVIRTVARTDVRMACLFTMSYSLHFPPRRLTDGSGTKTSLGRAAPRSGGARRNRTDDLLLAKQALSQLSYGPAARRPAHRKRRTREKMVGLGRFELPTSRLSSARSNQLSYKPKIPEPRSNGPAAYGRHRARPRRKRNVDGGVPP
jgi:hypothetical protein